MTERPRSALLEEDALEAWVFVDYTEDGRAVVLTRTQYESRYRPGPEDQG